MRTAVYEPNASLKYTFSLANDVMSQSRCSISLWRHRHKLEPFHLSPVVTDSRSYVPRYHSFVESTSKLRRFPVIPTWLVVLLQRWIFLNLALSLHLWGPTFETNWVNLSSPHLLCKAVYKIGGEIQSVIYAIVISHYSTNQVSTLIRLPKSMLGMTVLQILLIQESPLLRLTPWNHWCNLWSTTTTMTSIVSWLEGSLYRW